LIGPETIKSRIRVSEAGCWEWTGYLDRDGYGVLNDSHRPKHAHRVSYQLFVGPIPLHMTIDHLCRNRPCVNPAHLEVVSRGENTLRGMSFSAINARKTACIHGHPFVGYNVYFRPSGGRSCRTCLKLRQRGYSKARKGLTA